MRAALCTYNNAKQRVLYVRHKARAIIRVVSMILTHAGVNKQFCCLRDVRWNRVWGARLALLFLGSSGRDKSILGVVFFLVF